jgi:putative NIF3 family GTP cyclohydrolase 1 type 2
MAITAQGVVDRIRRKLGLGWQDSPVDTILAGKPDTQVTGIITTYAPSLEVLHKAVASGKNMIISRESPYWMRSNMEEGGAGMAPDGTGRSNAQPLQKNDPIYLAKLDYIKANNLVVYRFFANWNAQPEDMQLKALARALGWEQYYKPSSGQPWATDNAFFELPPATLKETAQHIKKTLNMKSIRVSGKPDTIVRKAALSHGMYWLADLQKIYAHPDVDLLVMGEPKWENEIGLYSFDIADSGQKKGCILLGQQVSEEPGCGEVAAWLKSFVTEIPVEHISTMEPSWMPY